MFLEHHQTFLQEFDVLKKVFVTIEKKSYLVCLLGSKVDSAVSCWTYVRSFNSRRKVHLLLVILKYQNVL